MDYLDVIKKIEKETGLSFKVYSSKEEMKVSGMPYQVVIGKNGISHLEAYNRFDILESYFEYFADIESLKLRHISSHSTITHFRNLTSLDLRGNNFAELPPSVGELKNLTSLDLSGNKLTELPSTIGELKNLTSLDLSENKLTELPSTVGELKNLTSLDLSGNKLTELPSTIGELKNLTWLSLSGNSLTELPLSIGELKNLTWLNLNRNNLSELPSSIGELKNLTSLNLGGNSLTEPPSFIGELKNLTSLYLWGNKITELPLFVGELKNLTSLYLNINSLTELPSFIGKLKNLTTLYLGANNLTELPASINKLNALTELDIRDTKITTFPSSIFSLQSINRLNISNNEFETIPRDILDLNLPFVAGDFFFSDKPGIYIKDLKLQEMDVAMFEKDRAHIEEFYDELDRESVRLNETRVIFIGNGDAGKTKIIHRLMTDKFDDSSTATKGILINKHSFTVGDDNQNQRNVAINFWDFGGQEIMHSMHEFFLAERCLYVVVLDGRRDEEPEKWLDLVKQYGKNSPVIVVMNKIDQDHSGDVDRNALKRTYGNVFSKLHFCRISCKTGKGFDEFKDDLLGLVKETKAYDKVFPGRWNRIKNKLTEMKDDRQQELPYINEAEFRKYCNEEGISNQYNQDILLGWLHDLGVCFNYRSKNLIGVVDELKVLRPEWITNGIYKIITSEKIENRNGFLPREVITEILLSESGENDRYNNTEKDFILGMMHDFEMSYRVENSEFIPMLTQKSEPDDIPINYKRSVHFKIEYSEFLPTAILYQFVVRMQNYVKHDYTWRRGVFLEDSHSYKCKALIHFGKRNNQLHIYVEGDKDGASSCLAHIRSQLKDIQKNIDLDYKEYVEYCHIDGKRAFIDYNRLLNLLKKGILTDYIDELDTEIKVLDILKSFNPNSVIENLENVLAKQSDQLKERNDINERLSEIESAMGRVDANVSELLELSKQSERLIGALNNLTVEDIEKIQDNQLLALKSFFEESHEKIREIGNKELLEAVHEVVVLINQNQKKSVASKMVSVLSCLGSITTVTRGGAAALNNPGVQEFFQNTITTVMQVLSSIQLPM